MLVMSAGDLLVPIGRAGTTQNNTEALFLLAIGMI